MEQTDIQHKIMQNINPSRFRIDDYYVQHKCCPKCGSDNNITTLMGVAVHNEVIIDENESTCNECGDTHRVHDRVPKTVYIATGIKAVDRMMSGGIKKDDVIMFVGGSSAEVCK